MKNSDDERCRNECGDNDPGGAGPGASPLGRCYEICIGAQLDASWSDWFEGLEMRPFGEQWTKLCGRVADQAALLGILNKLCRLNLPLVSVNAMDEPKQQQRVGQEGGE